MDIRNIKQNLGKTVFYDTLQMNFDGNSMKEFIFSACILRKKKNGPLYYQAELTDATAKNSVLIVPLEKVLTTAEV